MPESLRPASASIWHFLTGVGSVLEILPPPSRFDLAQTDADAIRQDWDAVAVDLWTAIGLHPPETTGTPDALNTILKIKRLATEVGGMKKLRALVEALSESGGDGKAKTAVAREASHASSE